MTIKNNDIPFMTIKCPYCDHKLAYPFNEKSMPYCINCGASIQDIQGYYEFLFKIFVWLCKWVIIPLIIYEYLTSLFE